MAKNIVQEDGDQLYRLITSPSSGALSGDPVLCGKRPGVALINQDATSLKATVKFRGVAALPVKGINAGGNVAVAAGDELFFTQGDTPPISKKATGVHFGYAADVVGSGATATIHVDLGY